MKTSLTMEVILPQVISNVPAFLTKLWKMVDDPETSHLISWNDEGNSFVIHNQTEFASSLLPYYYKHSNMASFVRQLNMYGFHKVVAVDSGGLKSERVEDMEFAHPCFLRGHESLLESIKRKASNKAAQGGASGASYPVAAAAGAGGAGGGGNFVPAALGDKVNDVLNEVQGLKDKQEDMDGKLETMKKENEALWREVVSLRQKHLSQQKVVNKLIQFLVSIVQPRIPSGGGQTAGIKRGYQPQLAIEDVGLSREAKEQRTDLLQAAILGGFGGDGAGSTGDDASTTTTFTLGPDNTITSGPVIRDVTQELGETGGGGVSFSAPSTIEQPKTPAGAAASSAAAVAGSTTTTSALMAVDPKLVQAQDLWHHATSSSAGHAVSSSSGPAGSGQQAGHLQQGPNKRPVLMRELSREDMDEDINKVQNDLEHLKSILSGQITVDSSLISNLFSPEEPLSSVFAGNSPQAGLPDILGRITPNAPSGGLGGAKLPIGMESPEFALTSPSRHPDGAMEEPPSLFGVEDDEVLSPPQVQLAAAGQAAAAAAVGATLAPSGGHHEGGREQQDIVLNTPNDILNTPVVFQGDDSPFMRSIRKNMKK